MTDFKAKIAILKSSSGSEREECLKSLQLPDDQHKAMIDAGVLQAVFDILDKDPTDHPCSIWLYHMATNKKIVPYLLEKGVLEALCRVCRNWPPGVPKPSEKGHLNVALKISVVQRTERPMVNSGLHTLILKEIKENPATRVAAFTVLLNIAFSLETKIPLVEMGAVPIAFNVYIDPATPNNVKDKAFGFLRSISFAEPAIPILMELDILSVLKRNLMRDPTNIQNMWFCSNIVQTKSCCLKMVEQGFVPLVVAAVRDNKRTDEQQDYHSNGSKFLYNCCKHRENHPVLFAEDVVATLDSRRREGKNVSVCTMGVALLLGREEEGKNSDLIASDPAIISTIFTDMDKATDAVLSGQAAFTKQSHTVDEYLVALSCIAIADVNKEQMCVAKNLDCVIRALKVLSLGDFGVTSSAVAEVGLPMLLELSFNAGCLKFLQADRADFEKMFQDLKSKFPELGPVVQDLMFRLKDDSKPKPKPKPAPVVAGAAPAGAGDKSVFISYSWANATYMRALAQGLKDAGFKVWLDVDQMAGSTVEAMAEGLDNASAVVMDISPQYKESANCRLEGMYAMQLHLPIIPVMFGVDYRATGWLGLCLGTKLWYPYHKPEHHESTLNSVIKELTSHMGAPGVAANVNASASAPSAAASAPPPAAASAPARAAPAAAAAVSTEKLEAMDSKAVTEWLESKEVGLGEHASKLASAGVDGPALAYLVRKDTERGMEVSSFLHEKVGIKPIGHVWKLLQLARKV